MYTAANIPSKKTFICLRVISFAHGLGTVHASNIELNSAHGGCDGSLALTQREQRPLHTSRLTCQFVLVPEASCPSCTLRMYG